MKVWLLLVMISLTSTSQSRIYINNRRKRSNTENFNVLLTIYKMNPLKRSNVYKMFSNRILLPRPDEDNPDLNYNSNESTNKPNNKNVKSFPIEVIRYAQQPVIDRPLHVDNKKGNFDPEHFFNTLIHESDVNKTNSDEAEILINEINHRNEKVNSELSTFVTTSTTDSFGVNMSERNVHLKVFNLNKVDNNEIGFDDADVLVVK